MQQLQEVEVANTKSGNGSREIPLGISEQNNVEWAWQLWLNRRALGRWIVGGFVVATIVAFLIPNQYESTAQLMPPDPHSSSSLALMAAMTLPGGSAVGGSELGGLASDLLGVKDAGAVFTDMLRSRTVKDRLIERFDLRKVYGTRYWENARKKLTSRTKLTLDRKSGLITITVTDRNPQRAQQLAQAYVEELDHIAAQVNTTAAHRERVFIEQRLVGVKRDLDKVSREFSEYSSQNATLDIKEQGMAMVEAAAVLQGQLIAAQSELNGLEQIYTDNNIRVRSLSARVDELKRQLKKVGGDGTKSIADDQEFPSIRSLPLVGVRWADLYRETKIQETVYELLTEQYENAKIEEAKETPVVKVLDVPEIPEKKSNPPRALIVFVGVLLGFAAGWGWLGAQKNWQNMEATDPRKLLYQDVFARFDLLSQQIQGLIRRNGDKP